jgi:SAM-dependent methyltransferase
MNWDAAAAGWAKRADDVRNSGMALSAWMIDAAQLHPGARVLELAAGPGDTGFLAAELIRPGGTLICSDGSEAMLDVARARAVAQGVERVEFKQLMLEWIDLPTASVDVILCRWGIMLIDDPASAAQECRRVLAPGGRLALGVWNAPELNPWSTIPSDALAALGLAPPADRTGPGMFALGDPSRLDALLASAGFVERLIEPVALDRNYSSVDAWIAEMVDMSGGFSRAWEALDAAAREALLAEIRRRAAPYATDGAGVLLPGSSLAAVAV